MSSLTRKLELMHESNEETLLKIAFASTDRKQINQHFGSARAFSIYGINQDQKYLLNVSQFGDLLQDGSEDKLSIKLDAVSGCCAIFCTACGTSGVKQLLACGIQPFKVGEGTLIEDIIKDLQREIKAQPSPWLARAMARRNKAGASRFDKMAAEGWDD